MESRKSSLKVKSSRNTKNEKEVKTSAEVKQAVFLIPFPIVETREEFEKMIETRKGKTISGKIYVNGFHFK